MSDQVKKIAPLIWSEIQKAQHILLHCHVNSDGDSVGSVLGMKHALEGLKKEVTVIWGDSRPNKSFASLPGYSDIQPKTIFDVDLGKFDLFIIQDSSSPGQISDKGKIEFPDSLMTVVIDHHATNTNFARINLVDPAYPSVCEILFDLFRSWSVHLTKEIGLCLLTGMYTDTGGFKYPGVSKNTFLTAAEIVETGVDFSKTIFDVENSLEPKTIEFLGKIYSSIEKYFGGNIAICSITYEELEKLGYPPEADIPEISNTIKSEIGNNVGIFMLEKEPQNTRVSMRTRDPKKFDVAKIAVGTGFGGGHPAVAGARLKMSLPDAKKHLLQTIQKVYPELGRP